jgi:hypothetical protein
MAEAAAVATVVGIASFGIQLTKILYDFGSTVSGAREETSYIARHVDLYANVLDILTERIDDEEPILTDAALDLIEELHYQSHELFTKIRGLLPGTKVGTDDIPLLERVKWNFRKSKIALLVGELDYLRSTVHLLVTIVFTGRKIQRNRWVSSDRPLKCTTDDITRMRRTKSSEKEALQAQLQRLGLKAQNALIDQVLAQDKLTELQGPTQNSKPLPAVESKVSQWQSDSPSVNLICANTDALHNVHATLARYDDPADKQRSLIRQSGDVLRQLLQQWTVVGLEDEDYASPRQEGKPHDEADASSANAAGPQSPTKARSEHVIEVNVDNNKSGTPPFLVGHNGRNGISVPPSGPAPPPPRSYPGWIVQWSSEAGGEYWHEISTGKTQWHPPENTAIDDLGTEPVPAPPKYHPGWVVHWSSEAQRYYWHHLSSGRTQWEAPSDNNAEPEAATPPSEYQVEDRRSAPYAAVSGERTRLSDVPAKRPPQDKRKSQPRGGDKERSSTREASCIRLFGTSCDSCVGYGTGRSGKAIECRACTGSGNLKFSSGTLGPNDPLNNALANFPCMVCQGKGHTVPSKYHCKDCKGTGRVKPVFRFSDSSAAKPRNRERMSDDECYYETAPWKSTTAQPRNRERVSEDEFFYPAPSRKSTTVQRRRRERDADDDDSEYDPEKIQCASQ